MATPRGPGLFFAASLATTLAVGGVVMLRVGSTAGGDPTGASHPDVVDASGEQHAPLAADGGEVLRSRPLHGAVLLDGLGVAHIPLDGLPAAAQRMFDQGLAQLHGRMLSEAERSFRQVLVTGPKCAMAYWGVAMANVHAPGRARAAAAQALHLRGEAASKYRPWVDALARYYEVTPDEARGVYELAHIYVRLDHAPAEARRPEFVSPFHDRCRALASDWAAAVEADPDDVEARAFLIDRELRNRAHGIAGGASDEVLDGHLDQVLATAPQHPAHLYRMILWESRDAARALPSALAAARAAPANGNLCLHVARVYTALGRDEDALTALARGLAADHELMGVYHLMPYEVFHHGAVLEAMFASLTRLGRRADVVALAKNVLAMPRHPVLSRPRERFSLAGRTLAAVVEAFRVLGLRDALAVLEDGGWLDAGPARRARMRLAADLALAWQALGESGRAERQRGILARLGAGCPAGARRDYEVHARRVAGGIAAGVPPSAAGAGPVCLPSTCFWRPAVPADWTAKGLDDATVGFRGSSAGRATLVVLHRGAG